MIYLVFPSSWHPSQPYLSLPALKGFLQMHGVNDVVQRDLAIELLDYLCTWKQTQPLYDRIVEELNEQGRGLRDLVKLVVQSDVFLTK